MVAGKSGFAAQFRGTKNNPLQRYEVVMGIPGRTDRISPAMRHLSSFGRHRQVSQVKPMRFAKVGGRGEAEG